MIAAVASCRVDVPAPVAGVAFTEFNASGNAEAIATVSVTCDECAWEKTGTEAAVLKLAVDGRAPISLPIVRGGESEYRVMLGAVSSGKHTLAIVQDPDLSARAFTSSTPALWRAGVDLVEASSEHYEALSRAPFVYARPDTVGKFTDVPILMWYEVEPAENGKRYRYTVIFSNEDGGTPADRLMATWGRTTDIEHIYSVEIADDGSIRREDMQGPEHKILPFTGTREGRHPLLWVSTSNNMVLDHGTTTVRYAPAPILANLTDVSREMVMDTNAWTYEVAAKELAREGKIGDDPPPGKGAIPDPRRYAYLEGCGTLGNRALTFAIEVNEKWIAADRGAGYRIARDGCFRGAAPLPANTTVDNVSAVRVLAFARQDKPSTTPVIFTRLNTLFGLDENYKPTASRLHWTGAARINAGGAPLEIPVP